MQKWPEDKTLHAYVGTVPLDYFGKYCQAYGLLFCTPTNQSWHWGVKNNEHQWVDMEMFGVRRALLAIAAQDIHRQFRLNVCTFGAYLAPRLDIAAKWKRDMERGFDIGPKWNKESWIETSQLWDIYGLGMREAITREERGQLELARRNLAVEYRKIPCPLRTHLSFVESPEELEIIGCGEAIP